mmetsp:Transcript_13042/g.21114  ORF Transcript_13042/g.21114 Transcript_13042/m.21114 type:complete len:127 (-) Transcript_13042:94-474(-)|eukprot:CAMPEP_0203776074 /NCGR_PEP_ID=MMETSP0099_2-20121227/6513_1 /ASSEMBLY_ACC=CAM_ASM_000209 /TAXON_ID=96639 /ORGANISM=" , Strain NY0313808BC1" /LENGTH=126 /DNA_ID=CAMNT_0050674979 /DNA_START=438 /DNA_END=818 /DNA_ORIENTATION=+
MLGDFKLNISGASVDKGDKENARASEDTEKAIILGSKVECVAYMDALMHCYSPANQVSTYYTIGMVDDCEEVKTNFFRCLKLKMNYTLEEKEESLRLMKRENELSPTAGVWTFKDDPGSSWNPRKL